MTTVTTWNLHHMGGERTIPDGVRRVIESVRPDVLVLTEYVDRGTRASFRAALERLGYAAPEITSQGKGQNQVLMAARTELVAGELSAPDVDEASRTNFLHQWLPTLELNVIGFRAPYYNRTEPEKLGLYWQGLTEGALRVASSRTVYIGDFNWCPGAKEKEAAEAIEPLLAAGYRMLPEGGGVDRVLVSYALQPLGWQVVEEVAGLRLTGEGGLSDHPMLTVEVG